jgi:preprotein translocase subunit SecF
MAEENQSSAYEIDRAKMAEERRQREKSYEEDLHAARVGGKKEEEVTDQKEDGEVEKEEREEEKIEEEPMEENEKVENEMETAERLRGLQVAARERALNLIKEKVKTEVKKKIGAFIVRTVLPAIGAFLAATWPLWLALLVVFLVVVIVKTMQCEAVGWAGGLFKPVLGWFGITCEL